MLKEFAGLYRQLTDFAGVRVSLVQHAVSHGTPDACFPNNWISTHSAREGGGAGAGGERSLVLYPMKCPNRAAERRADVIGAVQVCVLLQLITCGTAAAFRRGSGSALAGCAPSCHPPNTPGCARPLQPRH